MTALGLLKIYSIVVSVLLLFVQFSWGKGYMSTVGFLGLCIILSIISGLAAYGFGWIFLTGAKWVLAQFGIVAGNDIVYVVVYIILFTFGGSTYRIR